MYQEVKNKLITKERLRKANIKIKVSGQGLISEAKQGFDWRPLGHFCCKGDLKVSIKRSNLFVVRFFPGATEAEAVRASSEVERGLRKVEKMFVYFAKAASTGGESTFQATVSFIIGQAAEDPYCESSMSNSHFSS